MDKLQDFTIDEKRFPLEEFAKFLKTSGLRYVPIIDAGIAIDDNYPYHEGLKRNVFIKNTTGAPLTGWVWPGKTHFPDFLHPNATEYWIDMFDFLYKKIPFHGVWLDMNEIASFCPGECVCNAFPGLILY